MLFGLRAIAREEGWRGYWRGLIPTLAGVSHSAVYFVAYEKLKEYRAEQLQLQPPSLHASKPKLSNTDYLLLSAISKILAGTLTYPHQVIRARMQTYNNNYNLLASPTPKKVPSTPVGLFSTIHTLYHSDGLRGFYRGLGPNLLRVVPSTCVTFLVYENVRAGLTALEEEM